MRAVKTILVILCLVFIGWLIWQLGGTWQTFAGFPKGSDAYAHLTRIRYILDFFPHDQWNYQWSMGMPQYLWYAPFPHYLAAALVALFKLTPEAALRFLSLLSYSMIGIGLFGAVYSLTRKIWLAILAPILVFFSTQTWTWLVIGGLYPRMFAMGFFVLFIWFLLVLVKKLEAGRKPGVWYLLALIFLVLTIQSQNLIALFAFAFFGLIFLFSPVRKILLLKLLLPAILVSFYLYLPLLFSSTGSRFLGVDPNAITGTDLRLLFSLHPSEVPIDPAILGGLFAPLLPAAGLLLVAQIILGQRIKGKTNAFLKKASLVVLLITVLFLIYALGRNGFGERGWLSTKFYILGFIPPTALFPLAIFATLYICFSIAYLFDFLAKLKINKVFLSIIALFIVASFGLLAWRSLPMPEFEAWQRDKTFPETLEELNRRFIDLPKEEKSFRYATILGEDAIWFNYHYQIPQTRDFFSTGILNSGWRFIFDNAIWTEEDQVLAKNFLDWFAVKWIFAPYKKIPDGPELTEPELFLNNPKFLNYPEDYETIAVNDYFSRRYRLIEYHHALPILELTNIPAMLVVGSNQAYNTLFRSLMKEISPRDLILVNGGKQLDSYKTEDLQRFPIIFLYEFDYRSPLRAKELLKNYLNSGGRLIIETANSRWADLGDVLPVLSGEEKDLTQSWELLPSDWQPIKEINLTDFSPPIPEGSWKIIAASSLAPDTQIILESRGQPIMVAQERGEARVIWMGANLPYHIQTSRNQTEAKFLAQAILWLKEGLPETKFLQSQATFLHPGKRSLKLESQAKGVIFRENFFPGWKAYLQEEGKRVTLPIKPAGPDLMYVALPGNFKMGSEVFFEYHLSWTQILGGLISIISLVWLVILAIRRKLIPT